MSVDYLHSSSPPPLKRLRDSTLSLPTILNTKCGEIFVNNNWDKWSFNCAFCQKTTSDIGVFVCHIRLEHLNEQQLHTTNELENCINNSITNDSSRTETNIFSNSEAHTLPNVPQQPTNNMLTNNPESFPSIVVNSGTICSKVSKIINLETLTDPVENSDKQQNDNFNKNVVPSAKLFGQNSKEFPEIIPKKEPEESLQILPKEKPEELLQLIPKEELQTSDEEEEKEPKKDKHKEIKHVFYINNDSNDNNHNSDSDNLSNDVSYKDDSDILSSDDSLTDDNDNEKLLSLPKKTKRSEPDNKHRQIPDKEKPLCPASYKCKICNLQIYSKHILSYHMLKVHGEKYNEPTMYTCRYCQKTYRSVNGLTNHLKTHNDKNFIQCPVCKSKYLQNFYVNHVLTHENNKCFPCQVCGQVFASNEERIKHWKTHDKEFPYPCEFCYRRFRKEQYLKHHLKTHYQYRCNFCSQIFNAEQSQKSPYVCGNCKEKPNVKKQFVYEKSKTANV